VRFNLRNRAITAFSFISLADVVLLLLVFFLLSSTFIVQPGIRVQLPKARIKERESERNILLTLTKDGTLYLGDETIELTRDFLGDPEGLYALQVQGNSMVDALVHDGDIVVMRHQQRVENGEMAAVWLKEREEVTLKRFYQEVGGRVRLQPANPTMQPIYVDDPRQVEVQGKVVMVIRQLQ